MAQFDVYCTPDGDLLLDCQSIAFTDLKTRLTAPLLSIDQAPPRQPRLNPIFQIDGEPYVMVTQYIAGISSDELRTKIVNLSASRQDIIGAIDMLLTGV